MKALTGLKRIMHLALLPVLATAVGVAAAQGPQGHDDHDQNRGSQNNNDNRNNGGHDQGNQGNQGNRGNQGNQNNNFRFRDQDRSNFQSHYSRDINRWRRSPQGRPQFAPGQRIPNNYRFQSVPSSYYRNAPPPPPGYQYGYYDGYVVAYNPTSRIIADVLDLVVTAGSR
jgi:Ni/Co efflux regulator RcnB